MTSDKESLKTHDKNRLLEIENQTMKKINIETARQYIDKASGKIFSAVFIKKNGEKRKMNCRRGVAKHVKGVGLKFKPEERDLVGVFDMHKKAYRFINLKTLIELRVNGEEYSIIKKGN